MSSPPRTQLPTRHPWHSPVNKLPSELLSMILLLANHVEHEKEAEFTLSERTKIPLALSTVNRHWRQVALDTPRLWTSICISPDLVEDIRFIPGPTTPQHNTSPLDTRHIISSLMLSRNLPLDIYIDARDMDFNFTDPPTMSMEISFPFRPVLFTPAHMRTALSLLVPHIHRWRSLTILTDTWAPMYEAINVLNGPLLTRGAPRLESLELVRCNDYASHYEKFTHPTMNKHLFLDMQDSPECKVENILPRLETLQLRGVHAEWSSLASILFASQCGGLRSLNISSHADEVRPSLYAFHNILNACPNLETFTCQGSSVALPYPHNIAYGSDQVVICHDLPPVELPLLREAKILYRTALQLRVLASLFRAPNVTHLHLGFDKNTELMFNEEVEGDSGLEFLGAGKYEPHHVEEPIYLVPGKDKDGAFAFVKALPSDAGASSLRRNSQIALTLPVFPGVTSLILQDVNARPHAFHMFFRSLPLIRELEFSMKPASDRNERQRYEPNPSAHAIERGLLPQNLNCWRIQNMPGDNQVFLSTPCPQLKTVSIDRCDLQIDLPYLLDWLSMRQKNGAKLEVLDLHLGSASGKLSSEEKIQELTTTDGATLRIFSLSLDENEEDWETDVDGDEEERYKLEEEEAYLPGGAFNDPDFDAHYTTHGLPSGYSL